MSSPHPITLPPKKCQYNTACINQCYHCYLLEDDVAPGNYGVSDAAMALEFLKDNVEAFGGDPERITVFGQSAGGAMTSHVMLSPLSNTLFQRGTFTLPKISIFIIIKSQEYLVFNISLLETICCL